MLVLRVMDIAELMDGVTLFHCKLLVPLIEAFLIFHRKRHFE